MKEETGAIIFPPRAGSFRGIHGSPQTMMIFNKVYGANPLLKPFPQAERNWPFHWVCLLGDSTVGQGSSDVSDVGGGV